MTTAEGRYTIVFNGEIYNFRDLRRTLEAKQVRFHTHSDTEVLLEAYACWGHAAVGKLRGAFAFAIWDERERRLFAARDRLGIRPFYYVEVDGTLLFASEMKGLLAHPAVRRELNYAALDDYLTYLYVPAPHTIFKNIRELLPAHQIEWTNGRIRDECFWDVKFQPENRGFAECAEELSQELREAVGMRLASDVPCGVFLSGGLDSSVIAALMASQTRAPVKTFTLGFTSKLYDERCYARRVSESIGAEAREQAVQPESAKLLPIVTRHFDEPFGNPTSLLTYQLSEAGRRRLTVALTGDGGDEVLLGYPRHRGVLAAEWYRKMPAMLRQIAASRTFGWSEPAGGNHFRRRLREFLTASALSPEQMYLDWVSYFGSSLRRRLYTSELSRRLGGHDSSRVVLDLFKRSETDDLVDRVNYVDLHSFLPYNVLRYSDRMSMAHGLELRSPFTDHVLVEKLARVPRRHKLRITGGKVLLRQAARGWLPQSIIRRPKRGLNPPMGLWIQGKLKPLLRGYLSPEAIRGRGYFRPEVIQQLISDHLTGRRDYSLHLWALISFEEWHRQYLDSVPFQRIPQSEQSSRILQPA